VQAAMMRDAATQPPAPAAGTRMHLQPEPADEDASVRAVCLNLRIYSVVLI
jgi:hypothetical protein